MEQHILVGKINESDEPDVVTIGGEAVAGVLRDLAGKYVYVAWAVAERPLVVADIATIAADQATNEGVSLLGIADTADGEAEGKINPVYSEITGYLWTDETGMVGGHDLVEMFRQYTPYQEWRRTRRQWYGILVIQTEPIDLLALADNALATPAEGE